MKIELENAVVYQGSNLDVLPTLPDNSVDSIVTDPPYELGFMGKSWDNSGIAYSVELWTECMRVLKPGGHLLAFGGSRTWHRLAVAIEDAGFEMRDSIAWLYGSGFPKSMDISKAIDKGQGQNQARQLQFVNWMRTTGLKQTQINQIIGKSDVGSHYLRLDQPAIATADLFDKLRPYLPEVPEEIERLVAERTGIEWTAYKNRAVIGSKITGAAMTRNKTENSATNFGSGQNEIDITAPATEEAKQWQGWGTALKPAFEPVVVARKPLEEKTVAANVLKYGTGGLNIDGSRIGTTDKFGGGAKGSSGFAANYSGEGWTEGSSLGRWPANIILDPYTAELLDEQSGNRPSAGTYKNVDEPMQIGTRNGNNDPNKFLNDVYLNSKRYNTYANEQGGASRFFYVAKASKKDRNEGLDELDAVRHSDRNKDDGVGGDNPRNRTNQAKQNFHPTVKPTALMEYLIKLVTPPNGTVLDPFTGSGSTGKAALLNGFKFIGIELTEEYLPIIEGRLKWASQQASKETNEVLF